MMYQCKKILATSMIFVLAAGSLTSCSSGSSTEASTTVDFYTDKGGGDMGPVLDHMLQIDGDLAGTTATVTPYTDLSSYETAVTQSLGTNDAPGMFTWWSGQKLQDLAKTGALTDLTDEWQYYEAAGINPSLADSLTVDGKIYAAPYNVLYYVVYYNKDVFDSLGLSVPTTWDELMSDCDTLVANGITPFTMNNVAWYSFVWFQQLCASYDPDLYNEIINGDVAYNSDEVKAVMDVWMDMLNKGYFADVRTQSDGSKDFAEGKCAMYLEESGRQTGYETDYGLVAGQDFDVFALPPMNDGDTQTIFYEIAPICVPADSSQTDAGIKTLENYYNPDSMQLAAEQGIILTSDVQVDDAVYNDIVKIANNPDYQFCMRFYESTYPELVTIADDDLWKFIYDPTEDTMNQILDDIQSNYESISAEYAQ